MGVNGEIKEKSKNGHDEPLTEFRCGFCLFSGSSRIGVRSQTPVVLRILKWESQE